jgi:O-antigen/teichoic acid export membrane protein
MLGLGKKLVGSLDIQLQVFIKRSVVVSIIRVIGLICVFCLQILLARLIGDSGEYGKYAWGQSLLFMTGAIAGMGVPIATSRFIASLSAQNKEMAVAAVIRRARLLIVRSSLVLVLVGAVLLFAGQKIGGQGFYSGLAGLASCLAPGVTISLLYQHISRGRQWFVLAFLPLQVARPVLTGALAIALWYLNGNSLNGNQTLLLVGFSILLIYLPHYLIYQYRQSKLSLTGEEYEDSGDYHPARLFRTARPLLLTRIASLSIEYSNVILVGILAGPAVAGAYFAAEKLAGLTSLPASIANSVNQADIAAAHARGNKNELVTLTRRAAHAMVWPTVAITFFLCIFAGQLVSLFGDGFSGAGPVLVILAIGLLLKSVAGPANNLLIMTGRQKYLPRVMVLTAAIHVTFLFVLIPTAGAVGAALTSALSGVFSSIWLFLLVRRELGMNPTIFVKNRGQTPV